MYQRSGIKGLQSQFLDDFAHPVLWLPGCLKPGEQSLHHRQLPDPPSREIPTVLNAFNNACAWAPKTGSSSPAEVSTAISIPPESAGPNGIRDIHNDLTVQGVESFQGFFGGVPGNRQQHDIRLASGARPAESAELFAARRSNQLLNSVPLRLPGSVNHRDNPPGPDADPAPSPRGRCPEQRWFLSSVFLHKQGHWVSQQCMSAEQ